MPRLSRAVLAAALAVPLLSLAPLAARAAAQGAQGAADVPNREAALEVRKHFLADLDTLQSKFVALAEAIPADKYAWRPAPGVRSIGEAFMHAASEYYTFVPAAYGGARSPLIARTREAFAQFEAQSTKADVLKHLREGPAYARQTLGALDAGAITGTRKIFGGDRTIVETSFVVVADLHEHLGQLIAYARMNGVKPPWTK
jgi:hypothetical protein